MDKIDLDVIIDQDAIAKHMDVIDKSATRECMKEAIHEALVLASEKAKVKWYPEDGTMQGVDKQSILDVEKLIC